MRLSRAVGAPLSQGSDTLGRGRGSGRAVHGGQRAGRGMGREPAAVGGRVGRRRGGARAGRRGRRRRGPGRPTRRPARPAGCRAPPASAGSARSPPPVAHGSGPTPGSTDSAVATSASTYGADGGAADRDPGGDQPAAPDDRQLPAAGAVRPGGDQVLDRGQPGQPLHPRAGPGERGQPVPHGRGLLVPAGAGSRRPCAAAARSAAEGRRRPPRGPASASAPYSSRLIRPSHGAPQRSISASAQADPSRGSAGILSVHCRSGSASCTAAIARSTDFRDPNGPR